MMQESDDIDLPQDIKKLKGRKYIFQIRLCRYNIKDELENL